MLVAQFETREVLGRHTTTNNEAARDEEVEKEWNILIHTVYITIYMCGISPKLMIDSLLVYACGVCVHTRHDESRNLYIIGARLNQHERRYAVDVPTPSDKVFISLLTCDFTL